MSTPRTRLPDAREFPRFAGLTTFARYPRLEDVAPDARPADWAIYGVPFDSGVTYRPGARFGPRAIRDASQYIKTHHLELGVTVTDILSLADAGDAPVRTYDCEANAESVAAFARGAGDPDRTKLLALGGDHSIALPNLRAAWARRDSPAGGLALIHFDAHLDTLDAVWGERYGHASPFIRAIEEGIVDPKRMITIGIRGPLNTARDLEFARDHGVTIVTCEEWRTGEGPRLLAAFLRRIGDGEAYCSFDIDVADPVYAPGTGTPAVGGLTSAEILRALRSLTGGEGAGGVNLVGADVVEVLPDRDVSGVTALLAAQVAFELLAVDAHRSARA